jgi:hypothetical protein
MGYKFSPERQSRLETDKVKSGNKKSFKTFSPEKAESAGTERL